MAGSWMHMTTADGRLRNNETFNGMLENGGDCYEAAEECYGMVQYLADTLAAMTRVGGGMFVFKTREQLIGEARANYQSGLAIGGVQEEGEDEPDDDEEGDPPEQEGDHPGPEGDHPEPDVSSRH